MGGKSRKSGGVSKALIDKLRGSGVGKGSSCEIKKPVQPAGGFGIASQNKK